MAQQNRAWAYLKSDPGNMSVKSRKSMTDLGCGHRAAPSASDAAAAFFMRSRRARAAVAAKKGTSRLSACATVSADLDARKQRSEARRKTHQQVANKHVQMSLRRRRLPRQHLEVHQQNSKEDLELLAVVWSERDGVARADALDDRTQLARGATINQDPKFRVRCGRLVRERKVARHRHGASRLGQHILARSQSPARRLCRRGLGGCGSKLSLVRDRRVVALLFFVVLLLSIVSARLLLIVGTTLLVLLVLFVGTIAAVAAGTGISAVLEKAQAAQAAQATLEVAALIDGADLLLERRAQVVLVGGSLIIVFTSVLCFVVAAA